MGSIRPGERLFARYAHGPNALGYCGPPVRSGVPGLVDVAIGEGAEVDVPTLAKGFSGAWPYQQVIADLTGGADPLAEQVVRAYWTGNELTDTADREAFWSALLERIRPQAGHYWNHLTPDLANEAAPTHLFHVLGVYPWTRLLPTGRPEPLEVLDSCRIRVGRVHEVTPNYLVVHTDSLSYDERGLSLMDVADERVAWKASGRGFVDDWQPGDHAAIHWGLACDRLDDSEAERLRAWTDWQLQVTNPRLVRAAAI